MFDRKLCHSCGESIWWHATTGPKAKTPKAYCATIQPYYRRGVSVPEPTAHTLPAMQNLTWTETGKQTVIDRTRVSPNLTVDDVTAVRTALNDYLPADDITVSAVSLPAVKVTEHRATVQRYTRKHYRLAFLLFRAGS